MNSAIVVAAGIGKRFGGDKPKQFLELSGKPVILHTLERFESCRQIEEIILVLPADVIENFRPVIEKYELKKISRIIAGGETRAASVLNGLSAVNPQAQIVAVHDGARPLVSSEEIAQVVRKARETGAACLVAAVSDTIKEISGDKILRTIDRHKLRRALTPQCFRLEILKKAFENAGNVGESATDECYLVERLGVEISVVEGSARNIKITVPEDLLLAETLLKEFNN